MRSIARNGIWERSVKATHHFLSATDFDDIKKLLADFDFTSIDTFCATIGGEPVAFVGVYEGKIEMLFASPAVIGKGIGALLLHFAIQELKADKVDVNEQNVSAHRFYLKHGFVTYETTEQDDQGKPYPLCRMRQQGDEAHQATASFAC